MKSIFLFTFIVLGISAAKAEDSKIVFNQETISIMNRVSTCASELKEATKSGYTEISEVIHTDTKAPNGDTYLVTVVSFKNRIKQSETPNKLYKYLNVQEILGQNAMSRTCILAPEEY